VLRLVDASVVDAKVASKAKIVEHVREEPVQLGCVQRAKQALKVSVHPHRQSVGQLPGTPDRDALAEAGRSEHVPNQSRELAHCPSEHFVVPLLGGGAEDPAHSKRKEVHDAPVLGAAQRRLLLIRGYKIPAYGMPHHKHGIT